MRDHLSRHKMAYLNFLAALVMVVVLSYLSLPKLWAVLVALVTTLGVAGLDRRGPLAVAISLLMALGLLAGAIWVLQNTALKATYRPGDMLTDPDGYYKPNTRLEDFTIPYGDLYTISGKELDSLVEPRQVDFRTDSLGMRNDRDYDDQDFVLLGDSFVVGYSTSQEQILSARLADLTGESFYNLAYPGNLGMYVELHGVLADRLAAGSRVVLVLFEGNDFACHVKQDKAWYEVNWHRKAFSFARDSFVYKYMYGLTRRALSRATDMSANKKVAVRRLQGKHIGFYHHYVNVSRTRDSCFDAAEAAEHLRPLADRLCLIVYVPTKYRVYHPLIAPGDEELPRVNLAKARLIGQELGVEVLDLTPELQRASRELLPEGKLTFWPDDTHWNPAGIRIAARAMHQALLRACVHGSGD